MSRIRSIHPGLWTDEAFVGLSPMARLFLMGLWNECDDMGSFAWSPLSLKMRILPGDNVDANELLAETVAAGIIKQYQHGGKSYGAVRNFCQFQRPKKPNSIHPQPSEIRDWVNTEARSTRDGSEAVGNQLPTDGEKCRQMEDGGDKGKSSEANASAVPAPDLKKQVFDLGVSLVMLSGKTDAEARTMVGMWRKGRKDGDVLAAFLECQAQDISNPLEWLQKRLQAAKWVSKSGYEYRGSDTDVLREAERRGDNDTYWAVKAAMARNGDKPVKKPSDSRRGAPAPIGQLVAARPAA